MSADLAPNQDAKLSVYFEYETKPVVGATVTTVVTDQSGGAQIATGPATADPALPGVYTFLLDATLIPATLTRIKAVFAGTSASIDLYHEAFYSVGQPSESAQTRRAIRNAVVQQLFGPQHLWRITFDAHLSNSVRLGYAPMISVGGDGEYRGRWLRFMDGLNAGQTRRVTGWASATKLIAWEPAVPTTIPPTGGARADLLPVDPDWCDQLLSDAIVSLGQGAFDLAEEDLIATDGSTRQFPLPNDATAVYQVGISWVNTGDGSLLFQGWFLPDDWRLVPGGKLELLATQPADTGPLGSLLGYDAWPTGYRLRVRYLTAVDLPLTDADLITVDPTYLRYTLGSMLTIANKDQERLTNYLAQQSEMWRPRATKSRPPNSKTVPR